MNLRSKPVQGAMAALGSLTLLAIAGSAHAQNTATDAKIRDSQTAPSNLGAQSTPRQKSTRNKKASKTPRLKSPRIAPPRPRLKPEKPAPTRPQKTLNIPRPQTKPSPPQNVPQPPPVPTTPIFKACSSLPKGLVIGFKPLAPIQTENGCGTMKPLRLETLKQSQTVSISPAATTNCRLTAQLSRWIKHSLQPMAIKLFGSPVAKLFNVASYACRSRNNRPNARLSEHAFANALDIAALQLASGRIINVKKHWHSDSRESRFLYVIHKQACRYFGTVLGPDSDAAHHDHFHLDMAKRRRNNYCR